MYRLQDNSKVDKYSIEYFNIFSDLEFTKGIQYMELAKKYRLSNSQATELIPTFFTCGAFRIKDLVPYLKSGEITKEFFDQSLPELRKLLKSQCIDERDRFEKIGDPVTEKELRMYLEEGYIDRKLALELYGILKKKAEKKMKEKQIKKDTHSHLTEEKDIFLS